MNADSIYRDYDRRGNQTLESFAINRLQTLPSLNEKSDEDKNKYASALWGIINSFVDNAAEFMQKENCEAEYKKELKAYFEHIKKLFPEQALTSDECQEFVDYVNKEAIEKPLKKNIFARFLDFCKGILKLKDGAYSEDDISSYIAGMKKEALHQLKTYILMSELAEAAPNSENSSKPAENGCVTEAFDTPLGSEAEKVLQKLLSVDCLVNHAAETEVRNLPLVALQTADVAVENICALKSACIQLVLRDMLEETNN